VIDVGRKAARTADLVPDPRGTMTLSDQFVGLAGQDRPITALRGEIDHCK
jgi:hypothetical protein